MPFFAHGVRNTAELSPRTQAYAAGARVEEREPGVAALALAEIYDGESRTTAARIGGVGLQIVRDWVVRFNARGPDAQRQALVEAVERGPIPAIHGVVRWRLIDLVQWLHDEFAVSLDETTVGRELKRLGYVKLTARPRHHAQNELAMGALKRGLRCRAGKGQGKRWLGKIGQA